MKLAVIPARGGSKRIPRKNIRDFLGKPIIAYSIDAAIAAKCFDEIIVSTDDEEIAEVAGKHGAQVPFMRPTSLSDDKTGTIPVVKHAASWFSDNKSTPDTICCIYATAPFLEAEDIRRGLVTLQTLLCDYTFSATRYNFPIQRALFIKPTGYVGMFQPEHFNTRSQDLIEAFHDAGQFYWGTLDAWLTEKPIFSAETAPILLPKYRVQDIDTLEDWERAEWLYKAMQSTS